jgi:cytoskeletal protein RodZ
MPSLSKRNRFRLLPMTAKQALDAVLKPGAGLITEQVAKQVVDAVGFTRRAAGAMPIPFRQQGDRSEESEIEPFLLSLVCRELNNRRQEQKLSMVSAELVQSSQGGVGQILSDFYDRCFSGMGPTVRVFVEDQLVGRTGYRQMIALADLQETPEVRQAIPTLVARRLLRIEEDRHGVARVELTHDVLTPIAVTHRNRRVVEEETARALQKQRAARRRRVVVMLAMLLVLAVGGMGVAIWQWSIATGALNLAEQRLDEVNKARELAQRRLESVQAAQQAAEAALKAYDTLKRASPASTPAAAQEVQQLQYQAQTELAVSNRIGAAANAPATPVQSATPAPLAPRAYIQVRSQSDAERAKQTLIPQLRKAGFTVPAPEVLATGPSLTEVRYFRPQEKDGAERIVSTLREAGIPNAQVKYVGGYENSQRIRQNHFEVWLAPANSPETPSR